MSILEKVIQVLNSYPQLGSSEILVDYSSDDGTNYTIAPSGSTIVERKRDAIGGQELTWQYNCGILIRRNFLGGLGALSNQTFIEELQFWLVEQNFNGSLPLIGDEPIDEFWSATNGVLLEVNQDVTTALYSIQIGIEFVKNYEEAN
jgi:hypothetical protein